MQPYKALATISGVSVPCIVFSHNEETGVARIYIPGSPAPIRAWGSDGMADFHGGTFDCLVDAIEPITSDIDTVLYSEVAALDDTVME